MQADRPLPDLPTVEGLMALVVRLSDESYANGTEAGAIRDAVDRSKETATETAILQYAERLAASAAVPPDSPEPEKLVRRWLGMMEYAYECSNDVRDSAGMTPRAYELRFLEEEMLAALHQAHQKEGA